jgi:type II secretory pathway pseudopilin PulG
MTIPEHKAGRERGFSLVEVTVAIGIFAFVAIGILGLLPAALRLRAESAQETRAAMIAEEMLGAVTSGSSLTNILIRQGPGLNDAGEYKPPLNLTLDANTYVFGYPSQTTIPNWRYRDNPDSVWNNGTTEGAGNSITTLARISSTTAGPKMRRVMVEVRSPATLPLKSSRPTTFSTLVYAP